MAAELVADLQVRGVTLTAKGDQIRWKGPLTNKDLDALVAIKPKILLLLRSQTEQASKALGTDVIPKRRSCFGSCPTCIGFEWWLTPQNALVCRSCVPPGSAAAEAARSVWENC